MNTRPCHVCNGTGIEIDPIATGAEIRKVRRGHRITMSEVAEKLALSVPYCCDLELGRRNWTPELIAAYRAAIETITPQKNRFKYSKHGDTNPTHEKPAPSCTDASPSQ